MGPKIELEPLKRPPFLSICIYLKEMLRSDPDTVLISALWLE